MACTAIKHRDVRILAEMAKQLSSVLIPESEFNPETLRYADQDPLNPEDRITYGQLAGYLSAATGRYVPVLFETPSRTDESSRVLVNKDWFERQASVAQESLGLITTLQSPAANQIASVAQSVNALPGRPGLWAEQPAPMSSDGLQNLHLRLAQQNDQRKAQQAASRDTEARLKAEERARLLEAQLSELTGKVRVLEEENRSNDLELRISERRRQEAEIERDSFREKLAIFAACFNPHGDLFPIELEVAFKCWCDITNNGSHNPSARGGRGVHRVVENWAQENQPELLPDQLKRLKATVSWRKKGAGAIRSK